MVSRFQKTTFIWCRIAWEYYCMGRSSWRPKMVKKSQYNAGDCTSKKISSMKKIQQSEICPVPCMHFSQSVSLTQYVVLSVLLSSCPPVPVSLLSKRPSSFCLIHFGGTSGAARGQKTTFDGR